MVLAISARARFFRRSWFAAGWAHSGEAPRDVVSAARWRLDQRRARGTQAPAVSAQARNAARRRASRHLHAEEEEWSLHF